MLSNQLPKVLLSASLLFPVVSLTSEPALANYLDFKVHNKTRVPIQELYVSSSATDNWEEDVLGRDILPAGRSTMINFVGNHRGCLFDVMAVFSDGDEVVKSRVNLCRISDLTFR
jgi:hypothetical protein